MASQPRMPSAPLFAFLYRTVRDNSGDTVYARPVDGKPVSDVQLGELLGCARSTVATVRNRGDLEWWRAERWAIRLNVHPLLLWPHFYDHVQWTLDDDLTDLVSA